MKEPPRNLPELLKKHNNNKTAVADELGVNRWAVWKWCKNLKVEDETSVQRKLREAEHRCKKIEQELLTERKRREVAENDLAEALERDKVLSSLNERRAVVRTLPLDTKSSKYGCTAIICACDWHLEKNIQPSTVSGLNEFNLQIAADRINRLWQKSVYLIDFFRNIGNVNEVILWLGGDLINNYLHDEDVESNFCGPSEAIGLIQDYVATGIKHITSAVKQPKDFRVVCNYGNHARTTRTMRPATGWKTSWEFLAYTTLAKIYHRHRFDIAQGYFNYTNVQGYTVRFHHGDEVKYYGGVGGLTIPLNKSIAQWDKAKRADHSINGHFHTYQDNWNWNSCGCLCGYDAYAQSIKADYQEPTQTIVFIDKSRGKVCAMPIFLESPRNDRNSEQQPLVQTSPQDERTQVKRPLLRPRPSGR